MSTATKAVSGVEAPKQKREETPRPLAPDPLLASTTYYFLPSHRLSAAAGARGLIGSTPVGALLTAQERAAQAAHAALERLLDVCLDSSSTPISFSYILFDDKDEQSVLTAHAVRRRLLRHGLVARPITSKRHTFRLRPIQLIRGLLEARVFDQGSRICLVGPLPYLWGCVDALRALDPLHARYHRGAKPTSHLVPIPFRPDAVVEVLVAETRIPPGDPEEAPAVTTADAVGEALGVSPTLRSDAFRHYITRVTRFFSAGANGVLPHYSFVLIPSELQLDDAGVCVGDFSVTSRSLASLEELNSLVLASTATRAYVAMRTCVFDATAEGSATASVVTDRLRWKMRPKHVALHRKTQEIIQEMMDMCCPGSQLVLFAKQEVCIEVADVLVHEPRVGSSSSTQDTFIATQREREQRMKVVGERLCAFRYLEVMVTDARVSICNAERQDVDDFQLVPV